LIKEMEEEQRCQSESSSAKEEAMGG